MGVREDREVAAPPALALAALATAGENIGFTVRDVRARPGLLLMTTTPSLRGASLGFIITVRARRFNRGTRLSMDATPVLGNWAKQSADKVLDDLLHEFQMVMQAPQARVRRPQRASRGEPFGKLPIGLALTWSVSSVAIFGLLFGGWWWIPAAIGGLGGLMVLAPRPEPWWSKTMVPFSVLSLPFGVLGLVARKLARTNALWAETVPP